MIGQVARRGVHYVGSRDVPTEGDDDAQNAEYRCVRSDHESDDNDAEQWLEAVVRG